jgi:hypothetical protein
MAKSSYGTLALVSVSSHFPSILHRYLPLNSLRRARSYSQRRSMGQCEPSTLSGTAIFGHLPPHHPYSFHAWQSILAVRLSQQAQRTHSRSFCGPFKQESYWTSSPGTKVPSARCILSFNKCSRQRILGQDRASMGCLQSFTCRGAIPAQCRRPFTCFPAGRPGARGVDA